MRKSESSIWPMRCKCQFSTPSPFAITLQLNLGQASALGANTLDQVPNIFFGVALAPSIAFKRLDMKNLRICFLKYLIQS